MAVNSLCDPEFWKDFQALPSDVQKVAKKAFRFWRENTKHPSVHFKPVKGAKRPIWEARVGEHYRALCVKEGDSYVWFWIDTHEEFNKLDFSKA